MLLDNTLVNPITIITLVLGTLLLVACLFVAGKARFNGMRLFLLVSVASLFSSFASDQNILFATPNQLTMMLAFSIGPSFYLFVCGLVYQHKQNLLLTLSHFAPAALGLMLGEKFEFLTYIAALSVMGYLVLSLRLVRKYHRASFMTVSFAEGTKLSWIYQFILTMMVIGTMEWVRTRIQDDLSIMLVQHWHLANLILLSVAFGFLINKAFRNVPLYDGLDDFEAEQESCSIEVDEAYRKRAKKLFKSAESKICDDRWYAESGLSVKDLSGELGANTWDMTWAISQGAGTTFCDFVNEMRVNAAKNAVSQGMVAEQIIALWRDVGFSSKESFVRVFKKFTGYGPKEYARLNSATQVKS